MENLVSILIFTPLLAALILAVFLRGDDEAAQRNAKWLAVTATGATFFMALIVFFGFEPGQPGLQFEEVRAWPMGLTYRVGIDAVSLPFVMLTAAIWPFAVAASWGVTRNVRDFIIALLVAQSLTLGAFAAQDLAFFALFFELAFVPLWVLVGLWGRSGGGLHALKAAIYALPGALLLIAVVAVFAAQVGDTAIPALLIHNLPSDALTVAGVEVAGGLQTLLCLGLLWSVGAKAGLFPFHGWLPGVSCVAPAAALMLIVAVGGKLGLYALLRFGVQVTPVGLDILHGPLLGLLIFGAVLMVLAALAQDALRPAIGYLSAGAMALPLAAVLSGALQGFDGAMLAQLAHGVTFAGLCAVLVVLEGRLGGDEYERMGGVRIKQPFLAHMLLFYCVSLFAMPLTASFPAHVLALFGLTLGGSVWAAVGYGVVLLLLASAAMSLYRRVSLGDTVRENVRTLALLDGREQAMLIGLGALILGLGLWPAVMLAPLADGMVAVFTQAQAALGR
ncbi:MAG: NADH-quinone oxidoreductase subunit M [Pseudomonadota bacterium]